MFIGCVSGYTDVQGNDDMGKAMGIETWPPDERPRERLLRYGPETLTDGQLLAILLGTGFEGWTALDVGLALLDRRDGLPGVSRLSARELCAVPGGGPAAAVIFVHNHPSGDPAASPEDRALTHRLVSAGEIIGIRVLDHVIIGDHEYISFADQGWLTP